MFLFSQTKIVQNKLRLQAITDLKKSAALDETDTVKKKRAQGCLWVGDED